MGSVIFLLTANLISNPRTIARQNALRPTQDNGQLSRKYPQIHPRFYSPFWRNKPRHAQSLQTGSVGVRSKFLRWTPFNSQTIDGQHEIQRRISPILIKKDWLRFSSKVSNIISIYRNLKAQLRAPFAYKSVLLLSHTVL